MGDGLDIREMLAVHECFRVEFSMLVDLISAVPDGDTHRSAVVGGHVMMMTSMLHAHHASEDELLWPLLLERAPDRAQLVHAMEADHDGLADLISRAQAQAGPWMGTASSAMGSALALTLVDIGELLGRHLDAEEADILPITVECLSAAEFAALGAHSRAALSPQQLAVGLGTILEDNSPEMGEVLLSAMPPEARAGFEQFGMPVFTAYRARLLQST